MFATVLWQDLCEEIKSFPNVVLDRPKKDICKIHQNPTFMLTPFFLRVHVSILATALEPWLGVPPYDTCLRMHVVSEAQPAFKPLKTKRESSEVSNHHHRRRHRHQIMHCPVTQEAIAIICGAMAGLLEPAKAALVS